MNLIAKGGFTLAEVCGKNNLCPVKLQPLAPQWQQLCTVHQCLLSTITVGLDRHSQGSTTDTVASRKLKVENFLMGVPLFLHLLPLWSSQRHQSASLRISCFTQVPE